MALFKIGKLGSLMAKNGHFSPRFMATFRTIPLLGKGEKESNETLENIKDVTGEVKKTVQDMREKINNAADEVIIKAVKAASRALEEKEDKKPNDSFSKKTLQNNKDSIVDKANNAKNFASDEINKIKNSTEEKYEGSKDKINDAKDSMGEKYCDAKIKLGKNINDAKKFASGKYEKMKGVF